jgi:hypothetical protein
MPGGGAHGDLAQSGAGPDRLDVGEPEPAYFVRDAQRAENEESLRKGAAGDIVEMVRVEM